MPHSLVRAEYQAMATTSCKLTWICDLLTDLQVPHPQLETLFCDNKTALHIATNYVFHEHTKYIKLDFHLVYKRIQLPCINLQTFLPNH